MEIYNSYFAEYMFMIKKVFTLKFYRVFTANTEQISDSMVVYCMSQYCTFYASSVSACSFTYWYYCVSCSIIIKNVLYFFLHSIVCVLEADVNKLVICQMYNSALRFKGWVSALGTVLSLSGLRRMLSLGPSRENSLKIGCHSIALFTFTIANLPSCMFLKYIYFSDTQKNTYMSNI